MRINPTVNHENYTPFMCRYDKNFIWNVEMPIFEQEEEE